MSTTSKNIVVCLDGTGNHIEENLSNVLKLTRILDKSDDQIVFYDQGVGTLGHRYTWGRKFQELKMLLGLCFGLGLDQNVLNAYKFIVNNYAEYKLENVDAESRKKITIRDRIYIFGFSRGAHTARVLAGLLYKVGLVRPEQIHLSGAALSAYKQVQFDAEESYEGDGANFKRVVGTRTVSIEFLGVWDTVSSVFVPNAKSFWPPIVREKLPYTARNPAVKVFRHAMAIDECRRLFKVDHWQKNQFYKPNIYSTGKDIKQDSKEVWFCGSHSDVGGGYKREDSGLSQIPFIWMAEEAKKVGVSVSERMLKYVSGQKPWSLTTKYLYPEPDAKATIHNSMNKKWKLFEFCPKKIPQSKSQPKSILSRYYLPLSEPRTVSITAEIHESVYKRIEEVGEYKPINLQQKSSS